MKGRFPRDCLISAYLHLLAKHCHSRADAEVHGVTGTLQVVDKSFVISDNRDISAAGRLPVEHGPVCSVCAGLHGIYFLF